jgi:ectoine hydroxylase-related dioxygenase (phytanoyl-CoA dioxygenase family)
MWYATHGGYADDTVPEIFLPNETGLTAWIAISRATVDNGTLWVLPGRHKEGLLPHVWDTATREWRGQFDTSWRVPAVLRPGPALMFRKYLPHASGPNLWDEPRMAYQLGFGLPGMKKVASPDVAPVLRGGEPAR